MSDECSDFEGEGQTDIQNLLQIKRTRTLQQAKKFKRRHGIRFLKICGEILSSDIYAISPFIRQFHAKAAELNLTSAQIYNVDETVLYFCCLPDKTYVTACEKTALGAKINKDRISVLLGANSDGSNKLKPLVIGKAKIPRCFVGFNNPLNYDNSANAWMTARIFSDWFNDVFVKECFRQFLTFLFH